MQGLPSDAHGVGSAVNQAIRQFGATFGVALTVALLGAYGPLNAVEHFQRVWWMLLVCGVLTSVASLALPRRRTTHPDPDPGPDLGQAPLAVATNPVES